MKVIASPQFNRKFKKFKIDEQKILESEIKKINKNPDIGESKKQDLQGILIWKFKVKKQKLLLSYKTNEGTLYLFTIGSHENYYQNLKNYHK